MRPPLLAEELRERRLAAVGQDLAAGGVDRRVGGGVLTVVPLVDLAGGGVADLVVAVGVSAAATTRRTAADGDRLRLRRLRAPRRRHLDRDNALDGDLEDRGLTAIRFEDPPTAEIAERRSRWTRLPDAITRVFTAAEEGAGKAAPSPLTVAGPPGSFRCHASVF